MSFYFPNVDPVYLYQRKEAEYIQLKEIIKIINFRVVLREVPRYIDKVSAIDLSGTSLTEVDINKTTLNSGEYKVDYTQGVMFFHEDMGGKEIEANYTGTGYVSMPAHRVNTTGDNTPPNETLQDIIDQWKNTDVSDLDNKIGNTSILETSDKSSTVNAINEVKNTTPAKMDYDNFKQETSTSFNTVSSQLAEIALKYGEIKLPNDFYPIDFKLYRQNNGKVVHDIDLDKRWINNNIELEIYIDTDNGDNNNGDGTVGNPFQTPSKSFESIQSSALSRFKIIIQGKMVLLNEFNIAYDELTNFSNKHVVITTLNNERVPVVQGYSSHRPYVYKNAEEVWEETTAITWEHHQDSVYVVERTNISHLLDMSQKDFNGAYRKFEAAGSVSECINTPYSSYIDGGLVYVNYGGQPTGDVVLVADYKALGMGFDIPDSVLFIDGLDIFNTYGLIVEGNINSVFAIDNSEVGESDNTNNLNIKNIGETYVFNYTTHEALRDGLNYHYPDIPLDQRRNCFVFEYNIKSYENGLRDTNVNNNCSTAHGGISILRVLGDYRESRGPVVADVNGCYSVLIDTQSNDSVLTTSRGNSYQFTTDVGSTIAKAILINCGGTSPNLSIITDSQTELILKSWFEGMDKVADTF
ncbi:hypothetical protein CIL05_06730 [Virgibacillus profundi]|uniref:Uncharacterized protein n=1 Tax=Virgibacillus profundi TaxID=2024555 RepID=A0A2A2IFR6_9BACI|nr:hypothetical protein [Virgibacillus profundi]PAV30156.1 hypothetical protein CIL05_06730 [Virgibacillus profundi]PXY54328.1 hypothetical protein CIT14_06815 [Virgibacillus profundi]